MAEFMATLIVNVISTAVFFVLLGISLRVIAAFKFNDKTWRTAFLVSCLAAFSGLVLGIFGGEFPTLLPQAPKSGMQPIVHTILSVGHIALSAWLIKKFYNIKWKPTFIFGLPTIIVIEIIAGVVPVLITIFWMLFAFSGGFSGLF